MRVSPKLHAPRVRLWYSVIMKDVVPIPMTDHENVARFMEVLTDGMPWHTAGEKGEEICAYGTLDDRAILDGLRKQGILRLTPRQQVTFNELGNQLYTLRPGSYTTEEIITRGQKKLLETEGGIEAIRARRAEQMQRHTSRDPNAVAELCTMLNTLMPFLQWEVVPPLSVHAENTQVLRSLPAQLSEDQQTTITAMLGTFGLPYGTQHVAGEKETSFELGNFTARHFDKVKNRYDAHMKRAASLNEQGGSFVQSVTCPHSEAPTRYRD